MCVKENIVPNQSLTIQFDYHSKVNIVQKEVVKTTKISNRYNDSRGHLNIFRFLDGTFRFFFSGSQNKIFLVTPNTEYSKKNARDENISCCRKLIDESFFSL